MDSAHLEKALQKLRRWRKLLPVVSLTGGLHVREVFYQGILSQGLAAMKVSPPPLYPVQSAANYSLLYVLMRAVTDSDINSVLELGAGQSTILLNAMKSYRQGLHVHTLETDQGWADRIGQRVSHEVTYSPLQEREVVGQKTKAYTDISALGEQRFDLILVDGPPGVPHNSRWASLEILSKHLADDFVVVFDDAERAGEQDTIRKFMQSRNMSLGFTTLLGAKCQFIAFTDRYRGFGYF